MGDNHHVRCVEELDNCLDGQIEVGRWLSKEHNGLGCRELLLLGASGTWSLNASAKYGTTATPSWSPAAGGGDEEDAGAGSGDEGNGGRPRTSPAAQPDVPEASEGPRAEEVEVVVAGEGKRAEEW